MTFDQNQKVQTYILAECSDCQTRDYFFHDVLLAEGTNHRDGKCFRCDSDGQAVVVECRPMDKQKFADMMESDYEFVLAFKRSILGHTHHPPLDYFVVSILDEYDLSELSKEQAKELKREARRRDIVFQEHLSIDAEANNLSMHKGYTWGQAYKMLRQWQERETQREARIDKIREIADENRSKISDAIAKLVEVKERGWSGHLSIEVDKDDLIVHTTENSITQFPDSSSWTGNHGRIAELADHLDADELDEEWMREEAERKYDGMVQDKINEIEEEYEE